MKAISTLAALIALLPAGLMPQFLGHEFIILGHEFISPTIADARSAAMGRTEVLSTVSSNGMFSNPAALAMLPSPQGQLGGRMLMGLIGDEQAEESYDSYSSTLTPQFSFNHLSFAMPYSVTGSNVNLAFGIGYRTYFDWEANFESNWSLDDFEISNEGQTRGGLKMITPALAVNLRDQFFIGAAFNQSVSGTIREEFKDTGFTGSTVTSTTDIEHSASFLQVGAIARISPRLTLGYMFRPAFNWIFEPAEYTEDGVTTTDEDGWKLTIPSVMGIGVSLQTSHKGLITAEYQTRNFSDLEDDGEKQEGIDNGACFRVGIENQGPTSWRFGFFRDAVFMTDEDDTMPKSQMGLTLGFGSKLGGLHLDTFSEFSLVSREYEGYDGFDYVIYEDKFTIIRLGLSLTTEF